MRPELPRRISPRSACAWAAVTLLALGVPASGQQTPSMPSTLRYGSGLLDIPVSSVLPHLNVTATYSGYFLSLDRSVIVDPSGNTVGFGDGVDGFFSDASVAVGLLDRFETGISIQSLSGSDDGGDIWGLFGRVRIWEPIDQGLGLAAGARYLTSPSFADGADYSPGRLGIADARLRESYVGGTNLSLYGVATAYLRGFDGGPIPRNDLTFTLGYGGGTFRQGARVDFYAPGHANGWFYGASLHVDTGERSLLSLMAEHNGFDVNVGMQFDWDGFRVGAHYLASNHATPVGGHYSEYQSPKFGLLASIAVCPTQPGFRCRPRSMRRTEPDTIIIPAPPPDTVIFGSIPSVAQPEGEPVSLCLATGQNVRVSITAAGDTLLGPDAIPLESLGPGVALAGSYAGGSFWYESGAQIVFEGDTFGPVDDPFPIDCEQVLRAGVHEGVPVFADRAAYRPFVMIFLPVRPGRWQRYERGAPPRLPG